MSVIGQLIFNMTNKFKYPLFKQKGKRYEYLQSP